MAQDLGLIDLLQLKNGVLLPMHDLSLPTGLEITGIRLILKGTDNHSIKKDGSRCEMQTPSGQQSGIKIHLASPFTLEEGFLSLFFTNLTPLLPRYRQHISSYNSLLKTKLI